MGRELLGYCKCGYEKEVCIGGGFSGKSFEFPHYCESCNSLTSVNVLKKKPKCTECGSKDIKSYEAITKELPDDVSGLPYFMMKDYHKREDVQVENFCHQLDKTFVLLKGNHYCPRCKENSLMFHITWFFD